MRTRADRTAWTSRVLENFIASAILAVLLLVASWLTDPLGAPIVRRLIEFIVLAAAGTTQVEIVMSLVTNARWTRSEQFRLHRYRQRRWWKRLRAAFNQILKQQLLITTITSVAIYWLVLGLGAIFVPTVLTVGQSTYFLCLRSKRDRIKRALRAPPSIGWPRSAKDDVIPDELVAFLINHAGTVGAPRAAWTMAMILASFLPVSFIAFDGPSEVAALARRAAHAATSIYEPSEGASTPSPESTVSPQVDAESVPTMATSWAVAEGDSFWLIAQVTMSQALGRQATPAEIGPYWLRLIAANLNVLVDPGNADLILPGQTVNLVPVTHRRPDSRPNVDE